MIVQFDFETLEKRLHGNLLGDNIFFQQINIDSRKIQKGEVYLALRGKIFNGHDYIQDAVNKGAIGVISEQKNECLSVPQLIVSDTLVALGSIAQLNRSYFSRQIVAVTGSSGKTTVKEMIFQILSSSNCTLSTQGNLNNEIGVPLTLLNLKLKHQYAVIELGANHLGEIKYTSNLVSPNIAIITNAGTAHVGEFGGVENIVKAKGEILEGLQKNGAAILNLDDSAFHIWKDITNASIISFSLHNNKADFFTSNIITTGIGFTCFDMHTPLGVIKVRLNFLGLHNVLNLLAAVAAVYKLGIPFSNIKKGLQQLKPVEGRAVIKKGVNGLTVIDDTYNANFSSICASIDMLSKFSGSKVLILGDMLELGKWSEKYHTDIGVYAQDKITELYTIGFFMELASEKFNGKKKHFLDQNSLVNFLLENKITGTVLIKGSRSMKMDKIVEKLIEQKEGNI